MSVLLFLLSILKVIGIILLCLIVILLLIIFLVLFVPIKYEIKGHKCSEIIGSVIIKWMFNIIYLKIEIDEKMNINPFARVFKFCILGGNKEYNSKQGKKTKSKKEKKPKLGKENNKENTIKKTVVKEDITKEDITKEDIITENAESDYDNKEIIVSEKPTVRIIKMADIEEKVLEEKSQQKSDEKENNCKNYKSKEKREINIEYFKKLPIEDIKKIIKALFSFIGRIFKTILPGSFKLDCEVGLGDPALTGYLLGISGIARGIGGKLINVRGNFEKAIFEGEVEVKGKITLSRFVYAALRLVFTKQIWRIIIIFLKG